MFENYRFKDDTPLLHFSNRDPWTLNDAYTGCLILGATGSGKTSASGRSLALAFLRSGFGGLVLCAKPEEAALWRSYAKEAGRSNSLIFLDGKNGRGFNFLEYELCRTDAGRSTSNAVSALITILDVLERSGGGSGGGGGDNPFWANSVRVLLSHTIDALWAAYGRVSVHDIMRFVSSAPHGAKDLADEDFKARSFAYQTLEKAAKQPVHPLENADYTVILEYFNSDQFGTLDSKTRSNIVGTLTSMVSDFLKGDLRKMFCTNTTTVPELCDQGAVIVLDLPLKTWERGGILAQQIFKFAWQRWAERRDKKPNTRPLFYWADECQLFLSHYDAEFQSTARSSKVCTVILTQSLSALQHAAGGSNPKKMVDTYIANFQTKIIHACQDQETAEWAANHLIGKGLQYRQSWNEGQNTGGNWSEGQSVSSGWNDGKSTAPNQGGGMFGSRGYNWGKSGQEGENFSSGHSHGQSSGESFQEVMDYHIQPSFFGSHLRTGGSRHGRKVDGVILQGGRIWRHSQTPWLTCVFLQKKRGWFG